MDLKSRVMKKGMELIQDPRVAKVVQDERVMKVAMQAFQLRGKVQEEIDQRVEGVAKSLGLVTKNDVRELKRTIKKLETQLKKQEDAQAKAAAKAEKAEKA
jgi:polyhydroxyalkanoate synthesis regulator phasin